MTKYRPQFIKYWKLAQVTLVLFCSGIYITDMLLGDGDGMMVQFGINPLTVFVCGQLFLLLLMGITSSKNKISKPSLSLCILIIGLWSMNFLISILPSLNKFNVKTIRTIDSSSYPFTSYDTIFFKNYVANTHFIKRHFPKDGGGEIRIHINNDAIRGDTIKKKAKDKHRILLIGDSFIQALQVEEEHTIGQYLLTQLPDSIEVIQHGFSSWSPLLEFNWLLRKGINFEPDEVMLFLFNNDFFSGQNVSDQFYTKYVQFDNKNLPHSFSFEQKKAPKRNIFNHFISTFQQAALVKFISYTRRSYLSENLLPSEQINEKLHCSAQEFEKNFAEQDFRGDPLLVYYWDMVSVFRDTSIWDASTRNRVDLSLGYLESMNNYLQEKGIQFSVKLIPFAHQFKGENQMSAQANYFAGQLLPNTGLNQRLDAFCREKDIPFLNLYNHFNTHKKQFPDEKLYFNIDGHWNENGHKEAAKAVAENWYLVD